MSARRPLFGPVPLVLALLLVAAAAEAQVERTFDASAGGQLVLDADRGSVEVRTGSGNRVRVEVSQRGASAHEILEDRDLSFSAEGNRVVIESRTLDPWWSRWLQGRTSAPRFEIEVPSEFNLDLRTAGGSVDVGSIRGEVRVRTSGGSLRFATITGTVDGRTSGGSIALDSADEADLRTSGGSVRVGDVRGSLRARTSGGSIRVTRAVEADVRTSGGSISLDAVTSAIDAHTSGGSITALLEEQQDRDLRLETSGGSVTLSVPDTIAAEIDASGGRVTVDLPVSAGSTVARNQVRGTINGGGPLLRLRTSGGGVQLRTR